MVTKSYPGRRDLRDIAVKCEFSKSPEDKIFNMMDSVLVQCNLLTKGLTCESSIHAGECIKLESAFHAPK